MEDPNWPALYDKCLVPMWNSAANDSAAHAEISAKVLILVPRHGLDFGIFLEDRAHELGPTRDW